MKIQSVVCILFKRKKHYTVYLKNMIFQLACYKTTISLGKVRWSFLFKKSICND